MRLTTRTSLAAILFAGLAVTTLAPAPMLAQRDSSTEPRSAAKKSRAAMEEDDALAEEKARWQREQDRVNDELYRQLGSMRTEVLRDTVNRMRGGNSYARERIINELIPFLVFVIILGSILWLIRVILENRRWNKVAMIQTDTHNKLLERLASSQEIIAYMESEAGKRFLESTPFEIERAQSSSLPYGRILWSAQIGVIVLMVGVAFLWLQNQIPDAGQALLVFGTLSLALGVGCLLSAGFSYILSRSLGLVPASRMER
jgi:hypothetical protein